jgi:hypothetical protein
MRTSLSLQWSLFRHQQRQLDALVVGASPAFKAYEKRYRAATRRSRRPVPVSAVHAAVAHSDLVYVGDYHTLKLAQQGYLQLVEAALATGRRVVLALEFVEAKHQPQVDAFLAGRLAEKRFLARIGHPYRGPFDIWPNFKPIFELARARGLELLAIDHRAKGPRSLELRDEAAARRLAAVARAEDRPLVVVLMGQFHIAPEHLPAKVTARLKSVSRRSLVVYQNAEGVYWSLARRGALDGALAAELPDGNFSLISASPVVCQRSFLDYVEAESGDAPIDEGGLSSTFRHVAKEIGHFAGVDVREGLEALTVVTATSLDALPGLTRRARFTPAERRQVEQHIRSRESAYLPRARAAWLASLSLNHAAEEAAHFVRHEAIGDAMVRDRPRSEAFWSRVVEEAIGFFGSRLVNPARRCTPLDEWLGHFQHGTGQPQQVAAFVLALSSIDPREGGRRLIPATLPLFNAVSHALGYLLGDGLARALDHQRITRKQLQELFHDPLAAPAEVAARWLARCGGWSGPTRRHRRVTQRADSGAHAAA